MRFLLLFKASNGHTNSRIIRLVKFVTGAVTESPQCGLWKFSSGKHLNFLHQKIKGDISHLSQN